MELIDSHTHLDFADFDADRHEVLSRSRELGVQRMVVLGVYQQNWQRLWDLVQQDADLYAAFGLHPVYLDDHRPADLIELGDWLTRLIGHRQLCAVGEIGLDYFLEHLDRERQQALFEAQLKLAVDFQLPALLHVRRSHAVVIATKAHSPATGRHHSCLRWQPGRGPRIHQARFQTGFGWRRHLASSLAHAQSHRPIATGLGGTGNRLTGHGARHVPRPTQ